MSDEKKPEEHHRSLIDVEAELIHHTELPLTGPSAVLDGIVAGIGKFLSWFWLLLVGIILYSVIGRYVFAHGSVTLEEVQWHLAGLVWLIGLSYTLVTDDHVRVDVFHEKVSLRTQAWIEVMGIAILLLPFLLIALWEAIPYFWSSYLQNEESQAPGGLPARWALKFCLPVTFGLLAVAAVSRLLKCTALLFGVPKPRQPEA
jgi:TRAP-type mannitol/chloroaromatic compound transport system permease small subunit